MDQRRPAERDGGIVIQTEHLGGIDSNSGAAAAMPAHVRRLEIDEVGNHGEGVVQLSADEDTVGLGLEREHGVPWLGLAQPIEPATPMRDEQVGQRRVVGGVAAVTSGLQRVIGREQAADRLHVVAQVHDPHR